MKLSINSILSTNESLEIKRLLQFIYGISDLEAKIIELILTSQHGPSVDEGICIGAMIDSFQRDRSLIQRCLTHLIKLGIVERERMTLDEYKKKCQNFGVKHSHNRKKKEIKPPKGSLYIYNTIPKETLKLKLMEISKNSFNLINKSIQKSIQ